MTASDTMIQIRFQSPEAGSRQQADEMRSEVEGGSEVTTEKEEERGQKGEGAKVESLIPGILIPDP